MPKDVAQLCPGVAPGGGRLLKCLSKNDYALSRSCLAAVTKVDTAREQVATLKRVCEPDAKKLCPGATGHAGKLFSCLKEKESQLSPECKSANPSVAVEAAELVDLVEEVTSQARLEDTIEILQGLNSVAFSRNQVAIQFDYLQGLAKKPVNADELTFNPLLCSDTRTSSPLHSRCPSPPCSPTSPSPPALQPFLELPTSARPSAGHSIPRRHPPVLRGGPPMEQRNGGEVGAPWVVNSLCSRGGPHGVGIPHGRAPPTTNPSGRWGHTPE